MLSDQSFNLQFSNLTLIIISIIVILFIKLLYSQIDWFKLI